MPDRAVLRLGKELQNQNGGLSDELHVAEQGLYAHR